MSNMCYNSFNFFSLAIGIMLMTVGGIQVQNFKQFPQEISSTSSLYFSLPALMVSSGCFLTFICLINSCFINRELSMTDIVYFGIFAVLFVIQLVVMTSAGVAINNSQTIENKFNTSLDHIFNAYKYGVKTGTTNFIQSNFECCGTTGPDFWRIINEDIPSSCCEEMRCYPPTIYKTGCTSAISEYFGSSMTQMLAFQAPPVVVFTVLFVLLAVSTRSRGVARCFFGCDGLYESL